METADQKPSEAGVKGGKGRGRRQAPRGAAPGRDLEDRGSLLIQVELRMWASLEPQMRMDQLTVLDERYHDILTELYQTANLCVDRYQEFAKLHTKWRRTLILGTGLLAVTNLLAANKTVQGYTNNLITIIAAVFAVLLTILANLESFGNSLEKAQGYRESREFFLDVAREFDRRWETYVRPLGQEPEACVNATELYRQVAVKDRELRAKFKEVTTREAPARRSP